MYEIANYDTLYRPCDKSGGELKHPDFVKLPVKPKGDGLQLLLEQKRGLEVFAVWCLLLEKTTSEKPKNRGNLLNHKEEPATIEEIARSISLKTKAGLVQYALNTLVAMGWVICSASTEQTSGKLPPKLIKDKISKGKLREAEHSSAPKIKYLDFVFLTENEYRKLIELYGKTTVDSLIEDLDCGIDSKGYKYKNHYKTLRNWAKRDNIPKLQHSAKHQKETQQRIRDEYEPYLKNKNDKALKDLRNDKAFTICHWLIDEILKSRNRYKPKSEPLKEPFQDKKQRQIAKLTEVKS